MQGIRRATTVFLVGSCLFVLFGGTRAWAAPAKQTTTEAEASFTADLNRERTTRGLQALTTASDLVAYARQHSADMAAAGRPYHDPNIQSRVQNWQVMGDNVGSGADEPRLHQGFMNSQTHRDEILYPRYTEVGVGCVWAGNVLYVTEVFRLPMPAAAASAAPARPAPVKVVTRKVTPAPAPAPRPAAPAAPKAAPPAPPTTAAPAPVADTSTSTTRAPLEAWPTAGTIVSSKPAPSPMQSPATFASIVAALLLMGVAGTQVAVLKRRAARSD